MISDVDDDCSDTIEYEEVLKMMMHKIFNRDLKDEILKAFRIFDDDETGKISFKNLKRAAKLLGQRITDENEILNAFRLFDDDGTGKISFKDLKRVADELDVRMVAHIANRPCLPLEGCLR